MENSAKVVRSLLSSLDIKEIQELEKEMLSDTELRARAGDVETFYKSHFRKVLELMIFEQLKFIGGNVIDSEALTFSRGTLNGLYLIKEWCEEQEKISLSRFDKDEE